MSFTSMPGKLLSHASSLGANRVDFQTLTMFFVRCYETICKSISISYLPQQGHSQEYQMFLHTQKDQGGQQLVERYYSFPHP